MPLLAPALLHTVTEFRFSLQTSPQGKRRACTQHLTTAFCRPALKPDLLRNRTCCLRGAQPTTSISRSSTPCSAPSPAGQARHRGRGRLRSAGQRSLTWRPCLVAPLQCARQAVKPSLCCCRWPNFGSTADQSGAAGGNAAHGRREAGGEAKAHRQEGDTDGSGGAAGSTVGGLKPQRQCTDQGSLHPPAGSSGVLQLPAWGSRGWPYSPLSAWAPAPPLQRMHALLPCLVLSLACPSSHPCPAFPALQPSPSASSSSPLILMTTSSPWVAPSFGSSNRATRQAEVVGSAPAAASALPSASQLAPQLCR